MAEHRQELSHPGINPETARFWEAAARGELYVKHCNACDRDHFFPRAMCPFCRSLDTDWKKASGRGRLYSYSVMRRAVPPFAVAYVTLEEGPTIFTNLVDCDLDALAIGQPVDVRFTDGADGLARPVFTPA